MIHYYSTFATPLGDFSAAIDENGALAATAFGDLADLRGRFAATTLLHDDRRLAPIRKQIGAYFAGQREQFDLPLAASGTPFQQRVWSALTRIPFGETRAYGELARELKTSARAIGRANATNPLVLIVPCHRVIGADGSLTGFAFGENCKRALLKLEQDHAARLASVG